MDDLPHKVEEFFMPFAEYLPDVRVDFYRKGSLVAYAEVERLSADQPMVSLTVIDEAALAEAEMMFPALQYALEVTGGMARVYRLSRVAMGQWDEERRDTQEDDPPF